MRDLSDEEADAAEEAVPGFKQAGVYEYVEALPEQVDDPRPPTAAIAPDTPADIERRAAEPIAALGATLKARGSRS
jgi:hypothetical protein